MRRGYVLGGLLLTVLAGCAGSPANTDGGTSAPDGGTQTPLPTPIPNCRPTVPASTGDIYEDCVARINQFRAECQHLPPLERWRDGESCANQHAEYDSTRSAHSGFRDNICMPRGSAQNECPGWQSTSQVISGCLQQMWDEGPGEDFQMHGHYINMSSTRYGRVACGFFTTSAGRIWAIQNFAQ